MRFIVNFSLLFFLFSSAVKAQEEVILERPDIHLHGTLLSPESETERAVLIIAGSGNTNRNGNTLPGYKNNALKKLAEALTDLGFATLRYDKRGVGESVSDSLNQEELRFEDFANDAAGWVEYLSQTYNDITVVGHSQGGLVAMLALQETEADRMISLAGMASDLHTTLRRQLERQPPFVTGAAYPILDSLKAGVKTESVPQFLNSLLHPSIQDYLISFMRYDPLVEIKKLDIPVLIVQGTTDLQITVEEAMDLAKSYPRSTLAIIDGMNHVLRESPEEMNANLSTYSGPELPLHPDLLPAIEAFLIEE